MNIFKKKEANELKEYQLKIKEIEFQTKKLDIENKLKEKEEINEKTSEKLRHIIMRLKTYESSVNNSISSSSTINSQNNNSRQGNPVTYSSPI